MVSLAPPSRRFDAEFISEESDVDSIQPSPQPESGEFPAPPPHLGQFDHLQRDYASRGSTVSSYSAPFGQTEMSSLSSAGSASSGAAAQFANPVQLREPPGEFEHKSHDAPTGPEAGLRPPQLLQNPRDRRSLHPVPVQTRPPRFTYDREQLPPPEPECVERSRYREESDGDSLPFETTRRLASKGRDRSSLVLPPVSNGIVMSKDKFEDYRRSLSSLEMMRRQASVKSTRSEDLSDAEDSDERNTKERRKSLAQARQHQSANLSVYRQKMTKLIGGGPLPNASTTTVDAVENDDDDIMDDVPLSILRAHGFPKRAPRRGASAPSGDVPDGAQDAPQPQANSGMTLRSSVSQSRLSQLPPLPGVFGDTTQPVARGLVGEIAKEEDAKMRRAAGYQSYDRERNRLSSLSGLIAGASGGSSGSQYNPHDSMVAGPEAEVLAGIQQQLQQLSEVQAQIISHINNPGMTPSPSVPGMRSKHASISGLSSIIGRSPDTPHIPAPETPYAASLSPGPGKSFPTLTPDQPQLQHLSPMSSRSPVSPTLRAQPSRMRLVTADEEEDEDEAWENLMRERQALRAQWRNAA